MEPLNPSSPGCLIAFLLLALGVGAFIAMPVQSETSSSIAVGPTVQAITAVPDDPNLQPPAEGGATPAPATFANADVTYVRAEQTGADTWTFNVTVEHPDTGWEDYANGWDVVLPDGTVLKPNPDDPFTRVLLHPHENEQPFTRSQSGIVIPAGVSEVMVRAHDLVDGWGGRIVMVDLTADSGPDFEVQRLQ